MATMVQLANGRLARMVWHDGDKVDVLPYKRVGDAWVPTKKRSTTTSVDPGAGSRIRRLAYFHTATARIIFSLHWRFRTIVWLSAE